MANGVARALLRDGFKRGDRIAILSANRTEYIAACFGIMRAGLVAVPVNFKFPKKTIDFVVRDAGAKLVFCDAERRADCPSGLPVVCFGEGGKEGFDKFLDPGSFTAVTPLANEPAMFLYTSGSTGIPKGVVLSHQSHLWVVETRLSGQDLSGQRYLIAAPLYHMNALALAQLGHRRSQHHRAAAEFHCARLYRGDREISLHLAHRGAADDRDDAARSGSAGEDRSVERAICPHGLGAGQPEPDVGAQARAAAKQP